MASTDPEYGTKPQPNPPTAGENKWKYLKVPLSSLDAGLRVLLFAACVTSVVVMVTSKQTIHQGPVSKEAKFNHSPALIYFVAALSVAGLYSIITTLASISIIMKPAFSSKFILHFAFWDVLIFGVVASATGTAGAVGYVGLKGNKHVPWQKVCNVFDKYCRHIAGSLAVSLFASVVLVLLIWLSAFTLHKKIPK
ncbi:CASP-like protein 1D1 [Ziziphus jujuba]|uniref:CASP-like protein n=1 Tax=Ziziphus jujuba TaxID=326968 RepID=A0ABM3I4X6_ZIZJJ|nr:CASP-like protein 1D1 [Ziziphus jujuba]